MTTMPYNKGVQGTAEQYAEEFLIATGLLDQATALMGNIEDRHVYHTPPGLRGLFQDCVDFTETLYNSAVALDIFENEKVAADFAREGGLTLLFTVAYLMGQSDFKFSGCLCGASAEVREHMSNLAIQHVRDQT